MANTSENKALLLGETGAELTWEEFKTIRAAAEGFYYFTVEGEIEYDIPDDEEFHQAGVLRSYYDYLNGNASTWGDRELDPGLIRAGVNNGLIGADVRASRGNGVT